MLLVQGAGICHRNALKFNMAGGSKAMKRLVNYLWEQKGTLTLVPAIGVAVVSTPGAAVHLCEFAECLHARLHSMPWVLRSDTLKPKSILSSLFSGLVDSISRSEELVIIQSLWSSIMAGAASMLFLTSPYSSCAAQSAPAEGIIRLLHSITTVAVRRDARQT